MSTSSYATPADRAEAHQISDNPIERHMAERTLYDKTLNLVSAFVTLSRYGNLLRSSYSEIEASTKSELEKTELKAAYKRYVEKFYELVPYLQPYLETVSILNDYGMICYRLMQESLSPEMKSGLELKKERLVDNFRYYVPYIYEGMLSHLDTECNQLIMDIRSLDPEHLGVNSRNTDPESGTIVLR